MKRNLIAIILLLATLSSYSQAKDSLNQLLSGVKNIKPTYSENSDIRVVYIDSIAKSDSIEKPAGVYINGKFRGDVSIMNTIDSRKIEKIEIEKESYNRDGVEYYGKVLVEMKSDYVPNFMTLKELSNKYLKLNNNPIVFQINENVIDEDCNKYSVDENFILKIIHDKVKTSDVNVEINLVKLITKTRENIDKANEVWIKGNTKTVANTP